MSLHYFSIFIAFCIIVKKPNSWQMLGITVKYVYYFTQPRKYYLQTSLVSICNTKILNQRTLTLIKYNQSAALLSCCLFKGVILAPVKNISNKRYSYVLPTTWSYTKINPPKNFSAILAGWMRQYKSAQPAWVKL